METAESYLDAVKKAGILIDMQVCIENYFPD